MTVRLSIRPEVEAQLYAGDDFELTLLAVDAAGAPVDITGAAIDLRVHAWSSTGYGAELIAKATGGSGISVVDPTGGEALAELFAAETELLDEGSVYIVARITTAAGRKGTLEPFLVRVIHTPLSEGEP